MRKEIQNDSKRLDSNEIKQEKMFVAVRGQQCF